MVIVAALFYAWDPQFRVGQEEWMTKALWFEGEEYYISPTETSVLDMNS